MKLWFVDNDDYDNDHDYDDDDDDGDNHKERPYSKMQSYSNEMEVGAGRQLVVCYHSD